MKYYDVSVRAIVLKTIRVVATDVQSAAEQAHSLFTVVSDGTAESYEQDTVHCSPGYDTNPVFVEWEDIRRDNKYPLDDDNQGFIYGIQWEASDGEILDVEWFSTPEKREKYAKL